MAGCYWTPQFLSCRFWFLTRVRSRPDALGHKTPSKSLPGAWWGILNQYGHIPLPELEFNCARASTGIFALWFSTSMGRFHSWYWQSMMTIPVLTFVHFGPVPVLAWYITGPGNKWCPYWIRHFCTFVQYQYGYGKLPVLALNGASTGIGLYAFWSSTTRYITNTGI